MLETNGHPFKKESHLCKIGFGTFCKGIRIQMLKLRNPRDKFPEKTLLDKLLARINRYAFPWFGICLQCYRFTSTLHDDSSIGWHCLNCCEKIYPNDSYIWCQKIERTCAVCGKKITVVLNNKGKILSGGHYFGIFRRGIGMWCSHEM